MFQWRLRNRVKHDRMSPFDALRQTMGYVRGYCIKHFYSKGPIGNFIRNRVGLSNKGNQERDERKRKGLKWVEVDSSEKRECRVVRTKAEVELGVWPLRGLGGPDKWDLNEWDNGTSFWFVHARVFVGVIRRFAIFIRNLPYSMLSILGFYIFMCLATCS